MNQPYINIEQGSDEWKLARLGHVTASNMADVMSKGKGSAEAIGRYKYKVRLVAERLTQTAAESFSNAAMEWGVEQEQFACIEYEAATNQFVDKTGFWLHPNIPYLGVSPDRLVGDKGLIEVKCPNTTTHLGYLFEGKIPTDYYKQIQCQLWVTDREWCDFVSYDPRLPKRNQLLIVRTERDESLIAEMKAETLKFLDEVENLIIKLGA
ncbi:phage_rel_nuc, putative phage-type endonuclease [uncultured Caudovirales phage]|uniref:Phage_rel_nuc, putative phage-type endonuclease n=1 Tax=uncultured Caudovirales phage TaxID=2100421 RepID=A0A6J5L3F5_9CAUD|nr:phage_rel_nuc, putative phage-type endonuclease [uncultured Caudovirales phage]